MALKINERGKLWKNASDEEKISYCEGLFESSESARRKRDFEWYMNFMFEEGRHYAQFNTTTNALETPPRSRGEVRLVVNKIKSSKRAIRNYSTRFRPKWEIIPGDLDPETIVNARRSGKLLDYLYRHLHLEITIGGMVDKALSTSVGFIELGWDDKAEGGLGQVIFRLHDPFDIYLDPRSYLDNGKLVGRYLFKAVQKSNDEIASDESYDKKNRKNVKPDDDLSVSLYKARIIRKEQGQSDSDKIKRTTIKEAYLWDDEENGEGGHITLFTYGGGKKLKDEEMKDAEYPIYVFQIPQDPLKIYRRAWVSDAVPLNKALDRSLSQKLMYVNKALVYRIIAEKGHGVNVYPLDNFQGEVLEVNKNREFKQWDMSPLPATLDSLTDDLNQYMEDSLSAHEASIGRLPTGARSGKTLEALQAAEANSLAGIRESLESFLSITGRRALEIISEKYVASRVIKLAEPEMVENEDGTSEKTNYLKVIGSEAGSKPKGATIVTGDNEVIVGIGSWLGYTLEARRETLKELVTLGALPVEEILRQYEFPNIEELSKKAREERLEQHVLQAEIAGRGGNQGGGQGQGGIDMVKLADKENMEMMNGNDLPPTEGATLEHTQAHRDFIGTQIFATAPPDRQQAVANHAQGELQTTGLV